MREFINLAWLLASAFTVNAHYSQKPLLQDDDDKPKTFLDTSIFTPGPAGARFVANQHQLHAYDEFSENIPYAGIAYFAHLNASQCFAPAGDATFDIAVVGAPFDLGVSYRPGARFGPAAARMGSRRYAPSAGYDMDHALNPFTDWATVVDCGDISNSPFDKLQAIHELEAGWDAIASRKVKNTTVGNTPRILSLGGDHTISLPAIRSLSKTWGPVAVIHFDSHLDTWDPKQLGGGLSKYADVNHGTMFHILHEEGHLSNHSNIHVGQRSSLFDKHYDLDNDARCGFSMVKARDLDRVGVEKIIEKIVKTVGDRYVYLSVDIDVLDPAFAPATGTVEPGGWTTRELLRILSGLSDARVQIVGADVVEFSPAYDSVGETTAITVSTIVYEILQWMVAVPVSKK